MADLKKRYEDSLAKSGEIRSGYAMICPYCFKENHDHYSYDLEDNFDEDDVACDHCDKTFKVMVELQRTFTSSKLDEEEDDE